jgi:glycosyltransferase involved in cell wall biosynthesis
MPTVELSMIVKNEEATLERCLSSVREAVDQIVIADTGSTDATIDIAHRFGAKVVKIPWESDFSKARNLALQHATCDWVLVLDADEMLDDTGRAGMTTLLNQQDVLGYDVWIWNYVRTLTSREWNRPAIRNPNRIDVARRYPAYVEHRNVRLFRRHPQIYFEGQVHEGVADRMKSLAMKVVEAPFVIHHLGMAEEDQQTYKRKMEFYRKLGMEKLRQTPNDCRAHFELGMLELESFRNPASALPYFKRTIELMNHSAVAWTFSGICLVRLGRLREGLDCLKQAEQLGARDGVHLEAEGDAHYHLEEFAEGKRCYEAAGRAGNCSAVLESKLGVCEVRLGAVDKGLRRIESAILSEPDMPELYDILAAAALWSGHLDMAANTAERRLSIGNPKPNSFLIAAAIRAQLGQWQNALEIAEAGCRCFPQDNQLRSARVEADRSFRKNTE